MMRLTNSYDGVAVYVVHTLKYGIESIHTEREDANAEAARIQRLAAYRDTPLFVDIMWLNDGEEPE